MLKDIIDLTWVSVLTFGVSLGYAVKLSITKDPQIIRSKKDIRVLKDPVSYATTAARLLYLLAAGSLLMTVMLFFSVTLAFIEIIIVLLIFFIFWKKMNDKYGPV